MDTQVHPMVPGLLAFSIVIIVITVLSVALRFWARSLASQEARRVLHLYWWDDWIALVTAVISLAQLALEVHLIRKAGLGHHMDALSKSQVELFARLLFVGTLFFIVTIMLARLAVLLSLSRIFPKRTSPRWFNYILWLCYALNTGWVIGAALSVIFTCDPVRKVYDPFVEGTCRSQFGIFLSNSAPSAGIDLIILILPLPKIWGLQISTGKKIGLIMTFVLGYSIIAVSIGRVVGVVDVGKQIDEDFSYAGVPLFFWLTAEPGIAILCACLPAMYPLGRRIAQSLNWSSFSFSSASRGTVKSKSGNFYGSRGNPYENHTNTASNNPETFWREDSDNSLEIQGYVLTDSRHDLFRPSSVSVNKSYHAHARGGAGPGEQISASIPMHAIRVERDVVITSAEQYI